MKRQSDCEESPKRSWQSQRGEDASCCDALERGDFYYLVRSGIGDVAVELIESPEILVQAKARDDGAENHHAGCEGLLGFESGVEKKSEKAVIRPEHRYEFE